MIYRWMLNVVLMCTIFFFLFPSLSLFLYHWFFVFLTENVKKKIMKNYITVFRYIASTQMTRLLAWIHFKWKKKYSFFVHCFLCVTIQRKSEHPYVHSIKPRILTTVSIKTFFFNLRVQQTNSHKYNNNNSFFRYIFLLL